MNKKQHDFFKPQIIERNATDLCIRCGNPGEVIHHINGDDSLNELWNLDWLCRSCNKLKRLQKKNLPVSTIAYQISAAHKKNLEAEPKFRRWLMGKMLSNNGHYPERFVYKEGAFVCDISIETVRKYLEKLCDHPQSPYITAPGSDGTEVYLKEKEPKEIDYL